MSSLVRNGFAVGFALLLLTTPLHAQAKSDKKGSLPTGKLAAKEWLKAPTGTLQTQEIDALVGAELAKIDAKSAPVISDEQFIRRVSLDLVGKLPSPSDIKEFVADTKATKRLDLVNKLLASDDFNRYWATYWREVISSRTTNFRANIVQRHFERWMTEQLKANKSWASITKDILTASGEMKYDEPDKNGQAYFLAARMGADAVTETAAEASRIFLGVQIQCAQCHDHPSDVWKREQFHQFAAYFARVRERPIRDGMKFVGAQLVSVPFGEHQMPGKDDPKKSSPIQPKFIDGASPGKFLNDTKRRAALAESVISKDNPWFAAAFVNRIWGHLMGQAFYMPIDDLGPEKEAYMPAVIARLSASFRGSNYDIKQLFRDIATSETYQRQIRPGESIDEHLLFTANHATRLRADALYQSLTAALGAMNSGGGPRGFMGAGGPFARFQSFEVVFRQEFGFDPSSKAEDVEGSISQALLMMNHPTIQSKIRAKEGSMLARTLATYTDNDEALKAVYMRTLARRPTDRELSRCREHIASVKDRAEAFEDVLWALINSTEFQTKR